MRLRTWTVAATALMAMLALAPAAKASSVRGDFDANGKDDVAIGVIGEKVDGLTQAGAVNVIYGSGNGLTADGGPGNELYNHDSPDIEGEPAFIAQFGSALAVGDFNGDGVDDLAVAAEGDDVGSVLRTGSVTVLYGDAGSGLDGAGSQRLTQGSGGLEDTPEEFDRFGSALTTGDFNDDGRDDLAIGTEESFDEGTEGAVHIVYGTASGLDGTAGPPTRFLHQNTFGLNDSRGHIDRFGASLASAELNGDGIDDLAIGAPGEGIGDECCIGIVHVIYGDEAQGVSPTNLQPDEIIQQGHNSYEGDADVNDSFGRSLTSGDFNGDGFFDLGIGTSDDVGASAFNGGALQVVYGSNSGGVSATAGPGDEIISQDTTDMPDAAGLNETFTNSVAAADFDGDGVDDIAIGNPDDPANALFDAGSATVVYGDGASGLNPSGTPAATLFNQGLNGVEQTAEQADRFGTAVTAGDFNGDDEDDLVVGAPGENFGANSFTTGDGTAHVIYGDPTNGISATNAQKDKLLHQGVTGIEGDTNQSDSLGQALSAPAKAAGP